MIIYNFVTGKKYGENVTQELDKICKQYRYKLGMFATAQQMKQNSALFVRKGQKAHKVTMFINGKQTYFSVFNIAQCFVSGIEKKLKTKTVYVDNPTVSAPKDATAEEIQALENILDKCVFENGNGSRVKVSLDSKPVEVKAFNYQEYKARKLAKIQAYEKRIAELEAELNATPKVNVPFGYGDQGMELQIENCPF